MTLQRILVYLAESKEEKELSRDKKDFIENTKTNPSQAARLYAERLPAIVAKYKKKHGIEICINGTTPYGQRIIAKKKSDLLERINKLKDDSTKYTCFFENAWLPPDSARLGNLHTIGQTASSDFFEHYKEMAKIIKHFLDPQGALRTDLSAEERTELNSIIHNKYGALVSKAIDEDIHYLMEKEYEDIGLTHTECLEEIKEIYATTRTKTIGYIYTNGHSKSGPHFECALIERNCVIKPIDMGLFNGGDLRVQDLGIPYYRMEYNFDAFRISSTEKKQFDFDFDLVAQAGSDECGTLCMLYLKELLKNNSHQLKEFTFSSSLYIDPNKLKHIFIPSPQVLRYSQVNKFNKFLAQLFTDTQESQKISATPPEFKNFEPKKLYYYHFHTLRTLIENSIHIAEKKGDTDIADQNRKQLAKFSEFSRRWLAEYEKMTTYRDKMKDAEIIDRYGLTIQANGYLVYRSLKMSGIATTTSTSAIAATPPIAAAAPATATTTVPPKKSMWQKKVSLIGGAALIAAAGLTIFAIARRPSASTRVPSIRGRSI